MVIVGTPGLAYRSLSKFIVGRVFSERPFAWHLRLFRLIQISRMDQCSHSKKPRVL